MSPLSQYPEQFANNLGLTRQAKSWRGPCPNCGYPNAFSLRIIHNGRICFFAACGCERENVETAIRAAGVGISLPTTRYDAGNRADVRERKRQTARRIWDGSVAAVGTLADVYLTGRALPHLAESTALRFRGDCQHPEAGRVPAMVAQVVDESGVFLGVHRTFLRADGTSKAEVEPQRASLGSLWGGAIRLNFFNDKLVVAEGIETAASAGRLLGLPAWAAISAGNLAQGLVLPPNVRTVVVAADADEPGERAARQASLRWEREGRMVRIARPNACGSDFNDVLRSCENG